LLAVHSNFENSHLPLMKEYFNGQFPDFTMEWYYKVGPIFPQTLIIISLTPIIDTIVAVCWLRYK
jgi:hypothetical protein